MSGYPFSKKQLQDAARIYAKRRTDALGSSLDQEPVQFSLEFERKISSIVSAADTAMRKRKRIRSRVAAAVIAVIVLLTTFFSFNTTARAAFVNWIKEMYQKYIHYEFFGNKDDDRLPELIPDWLPDGFAVSATETPTPDHSAYTFDNTDGDGFILVCSRSYAGSSLYIWDNDKNCQHLIETIGNYEVDCYVSDDVSDYVWHDAEGKFFFTMNSNLPHEINVKIIENLKIK